MTGKANKCLIYSKQSGIGYACAEKTNIKVEITTSAGLPEYFNKKLCTIN